MKAGRGREGRAGTSEASSTLSEEPRAGRRSLPSSRSVLLPAPFPFSARLIRLCQPLPSLARFQHSSVRNLSERTGVGTRVAARDQKDPGGPRRFHTSNSTCSNASVFFFIRAKKKKKKSFPKRALIKVWASQVQPAGIQNSVTQAEKVLALS